MDNIIFIGLQAAPHSSINNKHDMYINNIMENNSSKLPYLNRFLRFIVYHNYFFKHLLFLSCIALLQNKL